MSVRLFQRDGRLWLLREGWRARGVFSGKLSAGGNGDFGAAFRSGGTHFSLVVSAQLGARRSVVE